MGRRGAIPPDEQGTKHGKAPSFGDPRQLNIFPCECGGAVPHVNIFEVGERRQELN